MEQYRNLNYMRMAIIYLLIATVGSLLFFILGSVLYSLAKPLLSLFAVELSQPVRYISFIIISYILVALLFLSFFRPEPASNVKTQKLYLSGLTAISILIGVVAITIYVGGTQQRQLDMWGLFEFLPTLFAGISFGFATLTFGHWVLTYRV